MKKIASYGHVKRKGEGRPPAPPLVSFCGFTGDQSGSMRSFGPDGAAEPLYEWYKEQAEGARTEDRAVFLSITTFDDKARQRMICCDSRSGEGTLSLKQCQDWMRPGNTTLLYDTAIADLARIQRQKREYLANLSKESRSLKPQISVVWALMTDGMNNEGVMTEQDLRQAVSMARNNGVEAFFLAANCDGKARGVQYGFSEDTSLTVASTPCEMRSAMVATGSLMRASSSGATHRGYSKTMRQSSCPAGTGAGTGAGQAGSKQQLRHPVHRARQMGLRQ